MDSGLSGTRRLGSPLVGDMGLRRDQGGQNGPGKSTRWLAMVRVEGQDVVPGPLWVLGLGWGEGARPTAVSMCWALSVEGSGSWVVGDTGLSRYLLVPPLCPSLP